MRHASAALLLAATLAVGACQTQETAHNAAGSAHPFLRPDIGRCMNWAGEALPTGDLTTSAITLEKMAPCMICANSAFEYRIRVHNISGSKLNNVVVSDSLPGEGYKYEGATPSSKRSSTGLRWEFGDMKPGAIEEITVRGRSGETMSAMPCCAAVTYGAPPAPPAPPKPLPPAPPPPPVLVPGLVLTKTAPAETCIFEEIPIHLVVKNTGDGKATDVKIVDQLPDGWTVGGKPTVSFDVGALEAGASREFTANAKASHTGTFTNHATATGAGGLSANAASETAVRKAVLAVTKTASNERRYLGQKTTFTVTVTNTGDWVASNCTISDAMSGAEKVLSASDNGSISGTNVVWNLGALAPGASKTVTAVATRRVPGMIENTATATGGCADPASASAHVAYVGLSAVLLEVVDTPDPVLVGETTTYTISVKNQGTAADADIDVKATLEEGMEYVSATGPTKATVDGMKITFGRHPTLAVGETAVWTVVVRAKAAGDKRFGVTLRTKDTEREIIETEATRFYE